MRRCSRCSSPSAALAATAPISSAGCRGSRPSARRAPRPRAQLAERLARQAGGKVAPSSTSGAAGRLLIHAWPDRVAMARGERGRFLLANGRGAMLDAADPLAGETFLVVADLQGKAQNARIVSAAAISEDDIRAALGERIETTQGDAVRPREARRARARNRAAGRHRARRAPAAGADRRRCRSRDHRCRCASMGWRCCRGARRPRRCAIGSAGCIAGSARPGPICRTRR